MTFIILPNRVTVPPMLPDSDDYHRLGWTRQPGDGGVIHSSVMSKSDAVPPSTNASADAMPKFYQPRASGPSAVTLRDYQVECIEAIAGAWDRGVRAPLVVLPTGSGKTIIAAALMETEFGARGNRSLFFAHRRELLSQTVDKIRLVSTQFAPRMGVIQGSTNELGRDITIASIQTLGGSRSKKRLQQLIDAGPYHVMICDEAHHAVSPQWKRVLNALNEAFPDLRMYGQTATPGRCDGTALDSVFDEVVFERNLFDMIKLGYLVPPKGYKITLDVNLDTVSTNGGEFVKKQLSKVMNTVYVNRAVVEAWCRYGHNRKTLVFAVDVAHAIALKNEFRDAGYTAEHVDGKTKVRERKAIFKRFRDGETKILVNVEVATEGFDDPSIESILLARPTQSQALFIQSIGRGLRLWPGKTECLVIDCVGNSERHQPVQLASLVGFDPQRAGNGGSGDGNGDEGEDESQVTRITGAEITGEEFDLTSRRSTTKYQWRETSIGWVLQIPRIGYYLVAWHTKAHTRCVIRFYDQRPGRRDTPPIEVLKDPVDFELAYGLVEAEMDRIFNARNTRSVSFGSKKRVYDDGIDREFDDREDPNSDEPPAINFVDLDDGTEESIEVPEQMMLKDAGWRSRKVTEKQIDLLTKLGVKEKSLPDSSGEASDLITILRIEKDAKMRLPATQKQLAYLRRNHLPIGKQMTKGKAAQQIWKHRKSCGY